MGNALTSAVHDHMPVILDLNNYDLWLDPGMTNVDAARELLKPYDAGFMRCCPVSVPTTILPDMGVKLWL